MTPSEARCRELLPCPFCGGKPYLHSPKDNPAHESWVSCQSCQASSLLRNNECAVISAWNTRAHHAALKKCVEALEFYSGGDNEGYREWSRRMNNDCGEVAANTLAELKEIL